MSKGVLLTGASGFLGRALSDELMDHGYSVFAMVRSQRGMSAVERMTQLGFKPGENLHVLEGDLDRGETLLSKEERDRLTGHVDTVIHAAANVKTGPGLEKTNIDGTRAMLSLAEALKVPNFYHISSAYTCGMQTEASERLHKVDQPYSTHYEYTKCVAEHEVAISSVDFNTLIFRPSIIIGNSVSREADTNLTIYGILKLLGIYAPRLRERTGPPIRVNANPDISINLIPVDYVTRTILAALEQSADPGIYHITNETPPTVGELFVMLAKALHLSPTTFDLIPGLEPEDMTQEERFLTDLLAPFRSYFVKGPRFDASNTLRMLSGRFSLAVGPALIDYIINGGSA